MAKLGYGLAAAALLFFGCHTITEDLPTQPTQAPTPGSVVLTIPIPSIPGATPTPKPTPAPTPTPTPGPGPTPTPDPGAQGCGQPLPPPVTIMNAKIHIIGPNHYTLDSTPIVGPDAAYCLKIGFTDGRSYCSVRTNGAPDRVACETYAIGYAEDTGRPGPTWYYNGGPCVAPNCENHEDNQFLAYAYTTGRYEPCTKDGICGRVDVVR